MAEMKRITDYGTPEEEAWRWKILPWIIRAERMRDTWVYKSKYYDKPEGQDLFGKLVAINRPAILYGTMSGMCYAFMHSKPAGFQETFGKVLYFVWPFMGAATSFATVTYFSAKLRQKDDYWNYALGSCAAGGIVGMWRQCHISGWNAALFFCAVSLAQRVRIDEGFKWWTYKEQVFGDHRWHKCNWDIYTDPLPKNYTTSTTESKS